MLFSKSIVDFPTEVHRQIHIAALNITPLEVSLKDSGSIDKDLIESCEAYHSFIMCMLSDMYERPLAYGFNTGELEKFLNSKKVNGVKQKFPSKTKALLSTTHNSVFTYYRFLMNLASAGTAVANILVIPLAHYAEIKQKFNRELMQKSKTIDNEIPYQARLDALKNIGLAISEKTDEVVVTSESYPKMFYAMTSLAKSAETVKTFGEQGFFNCEFRQIFSKHTPDYEDVVQPLDNEKRGIADKLHVFLKGNKASPSCSTYWKVNYKYKGEHVFLLSTNGNEFEMRITGVYGWNDHKQMNEMLALEDQDFQKYAERHLNYCTGCSTSHLGCFATVLGKRKRVCGGGGIGFRIKNPAEKDMDSIKKFIEMRRTIIDKEAKCK